MQMTITSSKPETNVEAFWDNLIVEDTTERFAATRLELIGRMIGGWKRALDTKAAAQKMRLPTSAPLPSPAPKNPNRRKAQAV